MWDATKCNKLSGLAELTGDLAGKCNLDDHYLLQAYIAVGDGLIITTDGPLLAVLSDLKWSALHRDAWLEEYLKT